jgi:hypothetical protein
MNKHYPTAGQSPAEARKTRKYDFHCKCGEQWDAPGHMFWLCRMYCSCGEIVESGVVPEIEEVER